jgi:tRNA (Thr-GGU) A37 N-methylase
MITLEPIGHVRSSHRREGRVLTVTGFDAIDGTPVLDIKPVMAEFLPRTPVRQPGVVPRTDAELLGMTEQGR